MGFVLIQDGGDRPCKDFWVHFGTLKWTQVFTGICGIRFYSGFRRKARVRKCKRFPRQKGGHGPRRSMRRLRKLETRTRHCTLVTKFGVLRRTLHFRLAYKEVDLLPKGSVLEV